MRLELADYADVLEFKSEYQLNTEPLRVDVVIIKKRKDVVIEKHIAHIFRKDNILEYKSPEDNVSIWDLYKTIAYCYLYASIHKTNVKDLTLTIVETKYAHDVINYLQEEFGCKVEETWAGIYQISGEKLMFPVQIIESKRLSPEDAELLRNLRNNLGVEDIEKLLLEIRKHDNRQYLEIYMKTVLLANKRVYKEVLKMGDEEFDAIFEETGWAAKWEQRGELRGEQRMIDLLKSGKTPEEIIRMYDNTNTANDAVHL
jgi:hypothetical protein